MDFIDSAQLAHLVKDEQINFIGSAVTPWHAHSIDCAIHYLQDKGIRINSVILIKPAVKQGETCYLLSESNFTTRGCKYFKISPNYDTRPLALIKLLIHEYHSVKWYNRQYCEKKEKFVYIAAPWFLDIYNFTQLYQSLDSSYGFRLMLVEEGLSSYFPKINTKAHNWNMLKVNKRGIRLLMSFLLSIFNKTIRQRFMNHTEWTNLNLLVETNGKLQPNTVSIKYYQQVLTYYTILNKKKLPVENLNGCIVICTMAYLHSEIQDREDVNVLLRVVQVLRQKGLTIYLKPHPRDIDYRNRYAELGCQFLDCPCSVESLFVSSPKIRAVISFSSTSLVTAQILFGIKGFSVLHILDKRKFGMYIQEEMDSFLYCFSDIIATPRSLDELCSTI